MASRRRLRRRGCEGKQRHPDLPAAERHAFHLRELTGDRSYRAYRCRFCGSCHVGRPGAPPRQRPH